MSQIEAIPLFKVFMAPEVGQAVQDVLYSGYIAQGPQVDQFETKLCSWLGVPRALAVNSGTSALQLACTLAGVRPGTRVISTPMTCTATNTAIRAVGGEIVWADIDPRTGNIDPEDVERILRGWRFMDEPVAIMGVDWGGRSCNWVWLREIATKYSVKLIRDAAHAFGTRYYGYSHRWADYSCYSFQAIKHLTCIDGGALICSDPADHERGKLLRWFGIDRNQPRKDFRCEADVIEAGFKYHMNDVNATVGLCNLRHMNDVVDRHNLNGDLYNSVLMEYLPVRGAKLTLPHMEENIESAFWLYTVLAENRLEFMQYLLDRGITVSQVHARNDRHTMFAAYRRELPGVDYFTARQCSLPVGWWLTDRQREYILDTIIQYIRGDA